MNTNQNANNFTPDWVSPLGDTVKELLYQRMADCLHISLSRLQCLLKGDIAWTKEELQLLDVIFRDMLPVNRSEKDPFKQTSVLPFLTRREDLYWKEVDRLYTLDEDDALSASYRGIIHGKVYDLKNYFAFINDKKDKSYFVVDASYFYNYEKKVYIIRRMLHQDKVRSGIYWNAGINIRYLLKERPSYIFELGFKDNFSQPYTINMRPYLEYHEPDIKLTDEIVCAS